MTSIATNKPKHKPYKFKSSIIDINRKMYKWAENLADNELISHAVMHTLKAIISERLVPQATISQINATRDRSITKFSQDDKVCNRTIRRHIKLLERLKYIKVTRAHKDWKTRNSYFICVPDEYLVAQRGDIVSSSISCSSSLSEKKKNTYFKNKTKISKHDKHAPASLPLDGAAAGVPSYEDKKPLSAEKRQWGIEQLQLLKQMLGTKK